ncbi:hypothetical protein QFC24_004099 [Naganishia onofrii]|uniref:Uncharacterized protein n=1 Tax=Naganishia onofrii TaxID=1851511 RepID=A0ACC2XH00_9TREE|nr:hypothetical protein QFC24_004099 [Naganishia onofrii]
MSHNASPLSTASDHKVTPSVPPVTEEGKVKVEANPSSNPVPLPPRSPAASDSPSANDNVLRSDDEPTAELDSTDNDDDTDSDVDSDSDSGIYRPSPYFDTSSPPNTAAGRTISSLDDVATLLKTAHFGSTNGIAKNVIVLVGAGCSVSAGIPDFRSPETGLYANLARFNLPAPEAIFDLSFFKTKPEPFFMLCKDLYPVDTLETTAGLPRSAIVEAHGSFAKSHCIRCHRETSHEEMVERVRKGEVVRCKECGGLVKPDIVFFGEGLPTEFFQSMRTKVGEARGRWDDGGFRFDEGTRDFFWGGEADVGVRHLAEKLGWKNELDDLVRQHRAELKKEWGIATGDSEIDGEDTSAASSASPAAKGGRDGVRTSAGDEDRIEEVLANLAEDLKKVGLEEEGKSEL